MCLNVTGLMLISTAEGDSLTDGSSVTSTQAADGDFGEVQVEPVYPGKWPHTALSTSADE